TGENAGSYDINKGTLSLGGNYDLAYFGDHFAIDQRHVTVTADAGQHKAYGDADPSGFTYSLTAGSLVGLDGFSGALTRDAGEDVGSYDITQGTLALSSNYELTYHGDSFIIGTRPIEIIAIGVTVDPGQYKTYGDADPAEFTYSITSGSLVGDDTFSGALDRIAGEDVGFYDITKGTLALSSNYDLIYHGDHFSIIARPITITADAGQHKTYGDADPSSFTYSITSGSLVGTDTISGALSRDAGENAGAYDITLGTLSLGDNYALTHHLDHFDILKKALTLAATADDKTYDGNRDAAVTGYGLSGFVGAETVTASSTSALFDTKDAGADKGVEISGISLSNGTNGGLAGNYSVAATTSATADILQKALTLAATADDKTYDGNRDAAVTGYGLSGFVGAETVTASSTSALFDTKDAGADKDVEISGISLSNGTNGGLAGNYSVAATTSATAGILRKALDISGAVGLDKVYDGSDIALLTPADLSGVITGDDVTLVSGIGYFIDAEVGIDKLVTPSGFDISGADAGNYSLDQPAISFADILPGSPEVDDLGEIISTFYLISPTTGAIALMSNEQDEENDTPAGGKDLVQIVGDGLLMP
ncbi:MAG: hypothetical protein K8R48_10310, partial [Alphaproteobacteria bacterium]|nr:hypothetical protein [Alphaproteobacteria bacterium]